MFTEADFAVEAAELARLNGISEDLAGDYLVLIGDIPEMTEDWKAIVRDKDGREIARVRLVE